MVLFCFQLEDLAVVLTVKHFNSANDPARETVSPQKLRVWF